AVIPRKGMFYCFVCHAGGDVFTFFMKKLGMDYPTAVREVARRVGITIPERGPTGPDPREPLYSAVAAAADWFARQLLESPEAQVARDYLTTRHLDLETVQPLGLGYAPGGKAFLAEGYFDVPRLSLAGIEEVVPPLGTGLTPEQAQLVKRHAPHVILLYDSDESGLRATFRAGDELLREGLRVSVATLPAGEDP